MTPNFAFLYQLSLAIGTSLNLQENIQHFLSTLLEEVGGNNAAVYIRSTSSKNKFDIFSAAFLEVQEAYNEQLDSLHAYVAPNEYVVLPKDTPFIKSLLIAGTSIENNDNPCIIYPLGRNGFIVFDQLIEVDQSLLLSIINVIQKFSLSVEACLAYEFSTQEMDRRKSIQKALEENEEKYRTVVNNIKEGLVITDLNDNIIFLNQQMRNFSGYTTDRLLYKKANHVFIPDNHKDTYQKKIAKRINGTIEHYEMPLKHKDGRQWIASISASPYKNSEGAIIGTIAAITDVTHSRKREMAAIRNEEKYRSIIENMELGLLEVNPEGIIIKAYPKFCKLTGYTSEELAGKNASDVLLDPQEALHMEQQIADRKKGEANVYETQIKKKNGQKIWVMISGAPYYDEDNNVIGSVGIHLDITKRKQAEQAIRESQEKLQLILNTSLDAIFTIDETNKIIDWNPSATKIFGYSKYQVIGKALNNLMAQSAVSATALENVALFTKSNQTPVLNKRIELTALKQSGEAFPIELTISPIKIQDKYFFSVFSRDITERKKSKKALIDAKKAAEHARNLERQFLANMSHEIRTPMNAVIGMTYLLKQSAITREQQDYIEALEFSADNLMGIISDILDLSKIEAGEIELESRSFSLHHLLKSLQNTYQFKVEEKDIQVHLAIDPKIKYQVIGDKTRLGQILGNLLGNASKFTTKGLIGINATIAKKEKDCTWIKFQISDTGIGISKDNLNLIFNSFKQATAGIHREFGGTGLGLSIVKQLVELQGGSINVESKLNKGSVFSILLPFKVSNILSVASKKNARNKDKSVDSLQHLHVLIAEDNLINQKLITSILTQWQISFDLVPNGLKAVKHTKNKAYDIIFMDLNMPVMNGYEATKTIKSNPLNPNANTPVITLTAAALHEEKKRMFEVGAYDFITKPFSPQQLKTTILKCTNQHNCIKENLPKQSPPPAIESLEISYNLDTLLYEIKFKQFKTK